MTGAPITRGSPRTAAEPMAFTWREFRRGALTAWGVFNVLAPVVIAALTVVIESPTGSAGAAVYVLVFAPLLLVPISFAALVVLGAPLAYALGRGLRRTASEGAHLAAFVALGAVVGATAGAIVLTAFRLEWSPWAILLCAAVTAFPVAFGWWHARRRALQDDAGAPDPSPSAPAPSPSLSPERAE